jgi:hypothetical protein
MFLSRFPAWQAWLRAHKPPTLAFKRDLPEAEIHLLDAGHFALDERNDEIAGLILQFMDKQPR